MVPPLATTDQTGVIATTLLLTSLPTAVNCWVALMANEVGLGVTAIVVRAPAVTVTVAVPEMVPLVARTVLAKVPLAAPAVNSPAVLMDPPLATTDQTGVIAMTLPAASRPTATNCWVSLMTSVWGFGVTVMLASTRGSEGESHAADRMPAAATTRPTVRPRGHSDRNDRVMTDILI